MVNKKKILLLGLSALITLNLVANNLSAQVIKPDTTNIKTTDVKALNFKTVSPLELIASPQAYLNSNIKILAKFDKFSTLGLDYKPAFKDSKDYISLLIKNPGISDHTIPLSELKLLIPRDKAEKLIDLESGDEIELTGQVFSTALNDPWVDINNINVITSKAKAKIESDKKAKENKVEKK
ncbi:MAG: hypothetical protein A2104_02060 [Candidatus Melainabacteria bacterium GWF2_32_7]|nr:MAG: hypothetical protein A2104_02060 [Candidatus Melainabacteria bacterium GWF2_32_7]